VRHLRRRDVKYRERRSLKKNHHSENSENFH
jgi:hypothetical protein